MVGCDYPKCKKWFYTEKGLKIHKAKRHKQSCNVPDFIGLGIIKRKLTRKEAEKLTKEVMSMNIKDTNTRFNVALLKIIDVVNR